jgi:hypothetical protein
MGSDVDCVFADPDYAFLGASLYEQGGGLVRLNTGPQTETSHEQGQR